MSIAASIVVARVAGPTVLGTVAFGNAYASMLQFLGDLGLGTAHVKLISEGQDLGKCNSTFIRLKSISIGIYFIATVGLFLSQKFIFGAEFESVEHEYVIFIFIGMVTIQLFQQIPIRTFAAKTEQAKRDVPDIIRNIFLHIARIVVVLLGYKAITLATTHTISLLLITPFMWYLFKDNPFGGYDKELAKLYIKIAIPNILLVVSTTIVAQMDKVLLQFFSSSEEVGYYTAGYRIGGFILLIAQSVGLLFYPMFSEAISKGDHVLVKNRIEKFERFSFLFIMPVVIFLALYSDTIVYYILGEEYIPSINVLSVITVAMFIMVLSMTYGNVLTGMGLFTLVAKLSFINVIIFLLALVILIHPNFLGLDSMGAAYGVMISNVFLGLSYRYLANKRLPILEDVHSLKYIIFGIVNFVLFYFGYKYFTEMWGNVFRFSYPLIYFILTYLAFALFRMIEKEDLKMLYSLFDFKAMKNYIGGEMKQRKK